MPELSSDSAEQYARVRPIYEAFALRLEHLLVALLKESGNDYIQIESRAKEVADFDEKIRRKGKKYEKPLLEVTDLVGLRVITYYPARSPRAG